MFHYLLKAEFVTFVSLKVPSRTCYSDYLVITAQLEGERVDAQAMATDVRVGSRKEAEKKPRCVIRDLNVFVWDLGNSLQICVRIHRYIT